MPAMYYSNKIDVIKDLFGHNNVNLERKHLVVADKVYPIIDDVIILLDTSQYPNRLKKRLNGDGYSSGSGPSDYAEDIQYTFGREWQAFPKILLEHENEFMQYFDLIDLKGLDDLRVCDLGCGIGRWSYFLEGVCRELVLVDFSEAIFVARRNLSHLDNALFFMGDLCRLPFRNDFCDFIFCLGVLHHLPTSALEEVRKLSKYAPRLLIYLYYSLDNRPSHFRALFFLANILRGSLSKSRNRFFRQVFTLFAAVVFYMPFLALGLILEFAGINVQVPLYDTYKGKRFGRIIQDVYDRFFTGIEQRCSRAEIKELEDEFEKVHISDQLPYWHFVCERPS
jgi:SAM-dependent methyltransferase